MLSTSVRHSPTARARASFSPDRQPIDASQFHAQRRQHLPDVVVQLAGEVGPLRFLRGDELLRELAHLGFGVFRCLALLVRTAFESAEADDGRHRDDHPYQEAEGQQPVQVTLQGRLLQPHLASLRRHGRVVELFDFRGDAQHRFPARDDLLPEEASAFRQLLRGGPVEERIEFCPVLVEPCSQGGEPLIGGRFARRQLTELLVGLHVLAAIIGDPLTVAGRAVAVGVEQVVAHVNAGQVDVGAQPAQLAFDLVIPVVQLVEPRKDPLRATRRFQHRRDDQQQQRAERQRRDGPGLKTHSFCVASRGKIWPHREQHNQSRTAGVRLSARTLPHAGQGGYSFGGSPRGISSSVAARSWQLASVKQGRPP